MLKLKHISYFLVEGSRFHRSYCYTRTCTKGEASSGGTLTSKGRLQGESHSRSTAFLCRVYMLSMCLLAFTLGTIASFRSHKSILKGFHSTLSAVLIIRDVSWVTWCFDSRDIIHPHPGDPTRTDKMLTASQWPLRDSLIFSHSHFVSFSAASVLCLILLPVTGCWRPVAALCCG